MSFNIDDHTLEERKKVLDENVSLEGIAESIKAGKAKNIVVVMGAGASVSAGIPDFRTPGTGLYDNLEKYNLPRPEAVFDLEFFKDNPAPFYLLAKELFPGNFEPTPTHRFLKLLDEKGILRRVYTQNIDGLEALAGLEHEKVVQCHGGFNNGHCIKCGNIVDAGWLKEEILSGRTPVMCPQCSPSPDRGREAPPADLQQRVSQLSEMAGVGSVVARQALVENNYDVVTALDKLMAGGDETIEKSIKEEGEYIPPYVKPQITFFGENLPPRFHECKSQDLMRTIDTRPDQEKIEHEKMSEALDKLKRYNRLGLLESVQAEEMSQLEEEVEMHERRKKENSRDECPCDLMLVIGTSLQVHPVASLPDEVDWDVPRVLFNRNEVHSLCEPPGKTSSLFRFNLDDNYRDVFVEGDCDDGTAQLTQLLGWSL